MSKRSYDNYLNNPIIRGFVLTVEPGINLKDLNRDILLEIIVKNIIIFIPLLQTNKQLANAIEADPNIYFMIYAYTFRDECMILDLLTNDKLMDLIEKYNNNKYMRADYEANSCSSLYMLQEKSNRRCLHVMGSVYNIPYSNVILDKEENEFLEKEIIISQRRENIKHFTQTYIKSKSIKYLNELLRDDKVINYLSSLEDPRILDKLVITNKGKGEETELLKIQLFNFREKFPLQLPHAEFCFESQILLITYFYRIASLIGELNNELNLPMYLLKFIFYDSYINSEGRMSINEIENEILFYLKYLYHKGYRKDDIKSKIVLEYLIEIKEDGIINEEGIRLPSETDIIIIERYHNHASLNRKINKKTLKKLININKNIFIDVNKINKIDRIYSETIDYLKLKEKVCKIAENENCNAYWKSLLLKTFSLYMQDEGRRSSHYLMKSNIYCCLNCKKMEAFNYDTTLFSYFCNENHQNEFYKKLEKNGWNIDYNNK